MCRKVALSARGLGFLVVPGAGDEFAAPFRGLAFGPLRVLWVGLLVPGLLAAAPLESAGQQAPARDEAERFEARLAAGDYAAALDVARSAATPAERDARLAQIAAAQAGAGDRDAALGTAREIYDDRVRADVLPRVAAQAAGGAADFDSLIDLITSTVLPETWVDMGGVGSIQPFPTGVWIDAEGLLQPMDRTELDGRLAALRERSAAGLAEVPERNLRPAGSAPMRKVSLRRLEREVQLRLAAGQPPTEAMHLLAGLQRIEYIFVYPEWGDVVLAGPAGDWRIDGELRVVGLETGLPVLRLDDLVVIFRHVLADSDSRFGCLIVPRQEGLARIQAYAEESNRRPLRPGERRRWLDGLRAALGRQDIEVYGLDPATRAARVMVEADYRMKLVGMGLEEGVPGVRSYLDLIDPTAGEPPPMSVLRWWFTLDYDAVHSSADGMAFALHGQGLKVLSENELLTAEGERIPTGEAEELNRQFAESFTTHLEALARKYPVYGELRNLADLALVAALLRRERLPERIGWHLTCFGPAGSYPLVYPTSLGTAPQEVESVVNYRLLDRSRIVAGVSGGVRIDPLPWTGPDAVAIEPSGALAARHTAAEPKTLPPEAWWWD